MKTNLYKKLITAGVALILLSSCTHYIYVYLSAWKDKPVVIDGKANEWTTPLKYYDVKSKLQYAVSNDKDNLYFCIKASDEQTQVKMFAAGLQLWIDTTGKNEHQIGIRFPLPSSINKANAKKEQSARDQVLEEKPPAEKPTANSLKSKYTSSYKEMELSGFNSPGINGMKPIQNDFGVIACIGWDSSKILTYEIAIPFKTFYKEMLTHSDSSKVFGASIVLSAIPIEHSGEGKRGMSGGTDVPGGGGMSGGGGGRHGGGGGSRGGAPPHNTNPGSAYLSETNTIKMYFQLSIKK